ncbi:MAG: DUF2905 domain-containing protein [Bacteroidetes bacterium]|nr:DUF2905 domain-containing protein [Bacteroidota bacterium]
MEGLQGFGKTLIIIGVIIVVLGALLMISEKVNLPFFGKLPGDIQIKGKNFQIYFPIATSIVLSVLLTLILYLISYFSKK